MFLRVIIAPFWDDVDIERSENISYKVTTDPVSLERARLDISEAEFAGTEDFNPTYLFIATWYRVAEYTSFSSQPNNLV